MAPRDDNSMWDIAAPFIICLAFWLVLLLGLCCGCTRTVYKPVEHTVYRTDTVHHNAVRVDSVILRDSVAVIQKGDTVFMTRWHDRVRVKERTDTVYQSAVDSVRVEVPVPVERKLTRWERAKMDVGGIAMGAVFIAVCAAVVWLVKKSRR